VSTALDTTAYDLRGDAPADDAAGCATCRGPLEDDGRCDECVHAFVVSVAAYLVDRDGPEAAERLRSFALASALRTAAAEDGVSLDVATWLPAMRRAVRDEAAKARAEADDATGNFDIDCDRDADGEPRMPF